MTYFAAAWAETTPSAHGKIGLGDDKIRELKKQQRERFSVERIVRATENPSYDIGAHAMGAARAYVLCNTTPASANTSPGLVTTSLSRFPLSEGKGRMLWDYRVSGSGPLYGALKVHTGSGWQQMPHYSMREEYATGTVTTTSDSTAVTGSSTAWVSAGIKNALAAGHNIYFSVVGQLRVYLVTAVGSDTSITLNYAYADTAGAGQSYKLYFDNHPGLIAGDAEENQHILTNLHLQQNLVMTTGDITMSSGGTVDGVDVGTHSHDGESGNAAILDMTSLGKITGDTTGLAGTTRLKHGPANWVEAAYYNTADQVLPGGTAVQLAGVSPLTFDNDGGKVTNEFLPILLNLTFTAKCSAGAVAAPFLIQKSLGGAAWATIATFITKVTTTNATYSYFTMDVSSTDTIRYRVTGATSGGGESVTIHNAHGTTDQYRTCFVGWAVKR